MPGAPPKGSGPAGISILSVCPTGLDVHKGVKSDLIPGGCFYEEDLFEIWSVGIDHRKRTQTKNNHGNRPRETNPAVSLLLFLLWLVHKE